MRSGLFVVGTSGTGWNTIPPDTILPCVSGACGVALALRVVMNIPWPLTIKATSVGENWAYHQNKKNHCHQLAMTRVFFSFGHVGYTSRIIDN